MIDQIENLKSDYTDQYVVVDGSIPELARFDGLVGQIKTVNMNGRALVQFDAWNNIGWYDIDLSCLRVVPKPDPAAAAAKKQDTKKEAPRPATKPAATSGEKKLSPLEMARMQGAAKSGGGAAAGGAKKSTSDILAAARANKSAAQPAEGKQPAEAAKPAAKPQGGKLNTADILAAARAQKAAAEPVAEATTETVAPAETAAAEVEAKSPAVAAKSSSKSTFAAGQRPSVPEILAWCREHDSK